MNNSCERTLLWLGATFAVVTGAGMAGYWNGGAADRRTLQTLKSPDGLFEATVFRETQDEKVRVRLSLREGGGSLLRTQTLFVTKHAESADRRFRYVEFQANKLLVSLEDTRDGKEIYYIDLSEAPPR